MCLMFYHLLLRVGALLREILDVPLLIDINRSAG